MQDQFGTTGGSFVWKAATGGVPCPRLLQIDKENIFETEEVAGHFQRCYGYILGGIMSTDMMIRLLKFYTKLVYGVLMKS